MKKYLITGFSGFVSKYFLKYLEEMQIEASVLGLDLIEPNLKYEDFNNVNWHFNKIDLMDFDILQEVIYNYNPDYILHLAAFSSVAYSWMNPIASFRNNTNIFLNLLEAVRINKLKSRIISVGSSEEYGEFSKKDLPLKETQLLKPISPYAVARVAQENLSRVYVEGYGLDIILTRSFNHFGPGQKSMFVIPSIIQKIVELVSTKSQNGQITAGDISIIRDFLDVRDVVHAYYLLFRKGKKGEIYNVCSGEGIMIKNIINKIESILDIKISVIQDSELIRPNDIPVIIGDNTKLKSHTNWERNYSIDISLQDIIQSVKKNIL